eukprot:TRINITY_DN8415_c0_g1_i1.p1 TRINITY_DN8415_c0_g1~~TRINITY_DN8415_c0_g1_i1.p1  ORF type:complete len:304 (-),score=26.78 TRINITY_DN8415_c0_g1_i1:68-910(-)
MASGYLTPTPPALLGTADGSQEVGGTCRSGDATPTDAEAGFNFNPEDLAERLSRHNRESHKRSDEASIKALQGNSLRDVDDLGNSSTTKEKNSFNVEPPKGSNKLTPAKVFGLTQMSNPPPMPHPAIRPFQAVKEEAPVCVVSIGSVGHPVSCAGACKFVKRKAGCPNGAKCWKCHECPRTGDEVQQIEPETPQSIMPSSEPLFVMPLACRSPPVLQARAVDVMDAPSVGTIGHPQNCSAPCKFAHKPRGCKDGQRCVHCHRCHWTRKGTKNEHFDIIRC